MKIEVKGWAADAINKIAECHNVTTDEVVEAILTAMNEYDVNLDEYLPNDDQATEEDYYIGRRHSF